MLVKDGQTRISQKWCEEKDPFHVAVDGSHADAMNARLLNLKFDSLYVLYILHGQKQSPGDVL